MARPDDHDDFIRQVAKQTARLMVAVEEGEPVLILGHVAMLVNLLIEHRNAPGARPDDAALRRAVARLGAADVR